MDLFIIGVVTGGILVVIVTKSAKFFKQRQQIAILELANQKLRAEKAELNTKVSDNEFHINELKKIVKFHQEQIEHCLEWLSSISTISNETELKTHIVVTRRFRERYGLLLDDQDNTYISD